MTESELSLLMDRATSGVVVPTSAIVAGALARGDRQRRRRRVLAGVGSLALVAGVGAGAVALGHVAGSPSGLAPADSSGPSPATPRTPRPSRVVSAHGPDMALTAADDQIRAQIATMLPYGKVGPILTHTPWRPVEHGATNTDRRLSFTYNGSLVQMFIMPAQGKPTCESVAAHVDPRQCTSVGGDQLIASATGGDHPYRGVVAWRHGYEIDVMSYADGPADNVIPGGDHPMYYQHVAAEPPLTIAQLRKIATSDAWFR